MVFNLKVEMTREPVVKLRLLDIACSMQLKRKPRSFFVLINLHWDVIRLTDPDKPVTLKTSDDKVILDGSKDSEKWSEDHDQLYIVDAHQKNIEPLFSDDRMLEDHVLEVDGKEKRRSDGEEVTMLPVVGQSRFL
jgi:hypothetical protein